MLIDDLSRLRAVDGQAAVSNVNKMHSLLIAASAITIGFGWLKCNYLNENFLIWNEFQEHISMALD